MKKKNKLLSGIVAVSFVAATLFSAPPVFADTLPGSPTGLTNVVVNGSTVLKWTQMNNAAGYRVQTSTNSDFSTILEQFDTSARVVAPKFNYSASTSRQVYWRVAAFGSENDQSSLTSWTNATPIEIPAQTSPVTAGFSDGTTLNYPTPVAFKWQPLVGAISYEVQYAPNSDFTTNQVITTTTDGTTLTPRDLLINGDWGWRVRAKLFSPGYEVNYSVWSTPVSFSVKWQTADSTVVTTTPADTSANAGNVSDPVFRWNPVTGASYYKIKVARDSGMTNVAIPSTNVYGTGYVPTGYLLNGEYYWTVTAYDAGGNAGYTAPPIKFVQRWGNQSGPNQAPDTAPPTTTQPEARPVVIADSSAGSTNANTPTQIQWNKFEPKWDPLPRVTQYVVTVKSFAEFPNQSSGTYTCTTPNTSVTEIHNYQAGAQSPELYKGENTCLGYMPRFYSWYDTDGVLKRAPILYQWRVQGINKSGSGEAYGQGSLVTAESTPRYFRFTCDGTDVCGGSASVSAPLALDPNGTWTNQQTVEPGAPSPVMEWAPVAGTDETPPTSGIEGWTPKPREYEVRIYRGAVESTTTEVARFWTYDTKLRAPGVFRDENSSIPYHWRVRVVAGSSEYGTIDWDDSARQGLQWKRVTQPTTIPASYTENQNGGQLLKWTPQFTSAPKDGGNYGYRLSYRPQGTTTWNPINLEYPFWVPANQYGEPLSNGVYDWKVQPLDANNDPGRESAVKTFSVGTISPPNVTVAQHGNSTLNIKWDSSPLAELYQVSYMRDGDSNWTTPYDNPQQTSASITDLPAGNYSVRVKARIKGDQWSPWTTPVSGTITNDSITTVTPDNAVLGEDARYLQWNPVPGAARYQVQFAETLSDVTSASPIETTSTVLSPPYNVSYGKPYYWRVTALGEPSGYYSVKMATSSIKTVNFKVIPKAVGYFGSQLQGGDVKVYWNALTSTEAGSASGLTYQVRYRKANQTPAATWTLLPPTASTATEVLITGLSKNSPYEFQLAANNDQGSSRWSQSTTQNTPGVPGTPQSFKVSARSGTSLTTTWSPPSTDGGLAVSSYVLRYKKSGATLWTSKNVGNVNTYALTGLSYGTSYDLDISAVNASGGGTSSVIYGKTSIAKPGKPTTKLYAYTGKTKVTWNTPSAYGSPIDAYVVYYSLNNKTWKKVIQTKATVHSVYSRVGTKGKKVYFKVSAHNAAGWGSYSSAVSVKKK